MERINAWKNYDEKAMCEAYGKRMMFMALPFITGQLLMFSIPLMVGLLLFKRGMLV